MRIMKSLCLRDYWNNKKEKRKKNRREPLHREKHKKRLSIQIYLMSSMKRLKPILDVNWPRLESKIKQQHNKSNQKKKRMTWAKMMTICQILRETRWSKLTTSYQINMMSLNSASHSKWTNLQVLRLQEMATTSNSTLLLTLSKIKDLPIKTKFPGPNQPPKTTLSTPTTLLRQM